MCEWAAEEEEVEEAETHTDTHTHRGGMTLGRSGTPSEASDPSFAEQGAGGKGEEEMARLWSCSIQRSATRVSPFPWTKKGTCRSICFSACGGGGAECLPTGEYFYILPAT
jgi:hypothetical protein